MMQKEKENPSQNKSSQQQQQQTEQLSGQKPNDNTMAMGVLEEDDEFEEFPVEGISMGVLVLSFYNFWLQSGRLGGW